MTFRSGEIFAENYQLIKRLGAGSFGEVWLARNLMADINVAIKFYSGLDKNGVNDFKEEFKLAYRLSHPNLLHLNHFDVYDQCPYLVMPYCSKGSAAQLRGNVSERRIWEFVRDVSAGLAYLHSQNPPIIHQDIKLGNILIDENDRFIVTDFGISKKIEFHMQTLRSVKMESSGTLAYMSPERFKAPPVVAKAGDMWSVGMCVYELVTGQVLWEFGGSTQLGGAEIPSLGGNYSAQLSRFYQRCLAVNAWERPTAQNAYEEAKAVLEGRPVSGQTSLSSGVSSSVKPQVHYSSGTGGGYNSSSSRHNSYSSSHSSYGNPTSKKNVRNNPDSFWKRYGDMIKWGGGAVALFLVALGIFSLILPSKKEVPKSLSPVIHDTVPAVNPIIQPDTIHDTPRIQPVIPAYKGNSGRRTNLNPIKNEPVKQKVVVDKELEFWKECVKKNTSFSYNEYINRYPKGKYVHEARKRRQKIIDSNMHSTDVSY